MQESLLQNRQPPQLLHSEPLLRVNLGLGNLFNRRLYVVLRQNQRTVEIRRYGLDIAVRISQALILQDCVRPGKEPELEDADQSLMPSRPREQQLYGPQYCPNRIGA